VQQGFNAGLGDVQALDGGREALVDGALLPVERLLLLETGAQIVIDHILLGHCGGEMADDGIDLVRFHGCASYAIVSPSCRVPHTPQRHTAALVQVPARANAVG